MSSRDHKSPDLTLIKPDRLKSGAAAIHPYFGKVDPALARTLIANYSRPDDVVLDPFCGSGTVLHEGLLSGLSRRWDSSPLAIMIATAKLLGIYPDERRAIDKIRNDLLPYSERVGLFQNPVPVAKSALPTPRVHDLSSWFGANALGELLFLREVSSGRRAGA